MFQYSTQPTAKFYITHSVKAVCQNPMDKKNCANRCAVQQVPAMLCDKTKVNEQNWLNTICDFEHIP